MKRSRFYGIADRCNFEGGESGRYVSDIAASPGFQTRPLISTAPWVNDDGVSRSHNLKAVCFGSLPQIA